MKDKNVQKELEEISPFLAKLSGEKKKANTPENYFAYLENSVMQQVELEATPTLQTTAGTRVSLWNLLFSPRGAMSLASVALLIFAGFYFIKNDAVQSDTALQFADLTDAEILNYLTDNAETLDIYSLDAAVDASVLEMIEFEEEEVDYLLEEVEIDEIFE